MGAKIKTAEKTIEILNELEGKGLIAKYAIGGAVAAAFYAEHLLAIMLQTFRAKDKTRIAQMLDEADIDQAYLMEILVRHGLDTTWREFGRQLGVS